MPKRPLYFYFQHCIYREWSSGCRESVRILVCFVLSKPFAPSHSGQSNADGEQKCAILLPRRASNPQPPDWTRVECFPSSATEGSQNERRREDACWRICAMLRGSCGRHLDLQRQL